ncbi:tRNA (N(6)-L-threonylcarbamoyladenosine(37)-C(2))-methylthiotransferase MtaB [Ruminococcus sp. OM05-10BH]|uniref:Threonylcarbamoyladenosine tRNA methylthiotransferase MtaB n=1 Tax=Sellimonas catena TaxID=2994035 RepID=A0A9W6CDB8_9FIRM|nr:MULTISPECIES: tRNA (N(6)-L-threonylcarbamoyladenosine(37)-C(2))-methylthiotransferase MtaB [Clostridia]OUQ45492.1 tRNA (N(6)-L-threonylcarbamoyladenosine(37)-C(2))-methylthiotransferase MtaB [Drancourtella sp. An12]RHV37513.1 tRNA (N(6)-L-threonylcarbamoyladenosine(37)-C(2))-methylthiotransferase MtaB [Ruminococcus sp. OM05-10BH]GLG03900.1 tRNA (N(6)-L-threonylcarbamoyladenosine(37)-C(2))-methylthiotransferase MtaB [Sellimonas catena]GLG90375.1 tRNA (N(6)-L-threonylcarbamoyladenosine(37)-C(2
MKKAALHNLGCKVNGYETEAMQKLLEEDGYEIVPFHEKADVYVINTCTVTNIADRKSRQMLHRARKLNPEAVIVAAGCYVQAQEEAGQAIEGIDILIGNNQKKNLISLLHAHEQHEDIKAVIDINHTGEFEELYVDSAGDHTRAYIKIQDGCNQFCTYCIIPYVRGRIRSRQPEEIVKEVERLADAGYQEVVLTGIHASSYGVDFVNPKMDLDSWVTMEGEKKDLLYLIQQIHKVEGIRRIRLSSIEPRIITEKFAKELAKLPKVCPHFHLSMQSGCDATLKRMNRHYTSREYYEKCGILRTYFEHPAITTDVIVGFPGETQEEFETTRAFIEKVGFYETHVFKYSRRNGTKAASMPDQVPEQKKAERSQILLDLCKKKKKEFEDQMIGKQVEVLLEETFEKDGVLYRTGLTKEYVKVAVKADNTRENQILEMTIENHSQIMD